MSDKPFHHGNLRQVLLDEAEQQLRTTGLDGLSLRQLAKAAGVSHSAPRRHFPDRQALLVALAERALQRVTAAMQAALESAPDDPVRRFESAAHVFVDHAVREGALTDLMFGIPATESDAGLATATAEFATTVQRALHTTPSSPGATSAIREQMLVAATLRGLAGFLAAGRVDQHTADEVIEDAAHMFTERQRRKRD